MGVRYGIPFAFGAVAPESCFRFANKETAMRSHGRFRFHLPSKCLMAAMGCFVIIRGPLYRITWRMRSRISGL